MSNQPDWMMDEFHTVSPETHALQSAVAKIGSERRLALTFWKVFREEVLAICEELLDTENNRYLRFSEEDFLNTDKPLIATSTLNVRCGSFEFSASFDPLSCALIYAIHVNGLAAVLSRERVLIRQGLISLSMNPSNQGEFYTVEARPRLDHLDLCKWTGNRNDVWEKARQVAGWACASIVLYRQKALRQTVRRQSVER